MPASDREGSRDRDVSYQHSWSESGRSSVPMWDSSDPERAPPPLPLNPGASTPTTKANTSAGIAAAAKLIVERARESAPLSSYTSNRETPTSSPERSLIKGAHQKRMQTLQNGSVKDLRNYLDNKSPERSPDRPANGSISSSPTRQGSRDDVSSPFERSTTPTPAPKDLLKETPTLRPSARPPPRPLLGENTPPSATMLALQTMYVPEQSLNDISNGPSTPTPVRSNTAYDFSSQLLNLTTIANGLQREMAQLSRRSKDNATDLISLKEATSQRDEDIRKSLRELVINVNNGAGLLGPPSASAGMSRSASSFPTFLDYRAQNSPPSATKSYSVPRAASASGFIDERIGSPSPFSVEGAASVAMLEKIIREMVTKEGQERLQSSLSELLEKSRKENGDAAKKVEELSEFIKEKSQSRALVHVPREGGPPKLELNFDSPGNGKTRDAGGQEAQMLNGDEPLMKMLQRIKDSVAHAGGTSAEVKGLVRDLRGEVLGMGRDLGKKLETVAEAQARTTMASLNDDPPVSLDAEEVQRIVEESMSELKQHMTLALKDRSDQDDNAFKQLAAARSGPDGDEMYAVVKHALSEHGVGIAPRDFQPENPAIDREAVIEAVKDGLKGFEPGIEVEQYGLERDEILEVFKEGLKDYEKNRPEPGLLSIDKGEVYEAMQEALKDFRTPLPHDLIAQMKEELLDSVRQALDQHQTTASASPHEAEATRAAILAAVQEGMATHGPAAPREMEISRDDLFAAVKASLDGSSIPFGGLGEQVLTQLQELFDGMSKEFNQYTAANGRDTEQVLDAVKDGLESLRAEIESYVDRAQDVTSKDEIVDTVKGGLEQLKNDVRGFVAEGSMDAAGSTEMLAYMKAEFEHLHSAISTQETSRDLESSNPTQTAEILLAIKESLEGLKRSDGSTRGLDDGSDEDGHVGTRGADLEELRTAILNAHAHDKSELIETIQDSMGAFHAKVNGSDLSNLSGGAIEEIITELQAEFAQLKESLAAIVSDVDREGVVSGVRQSIDDLRTQLAADQSDAAAEVLTAIKEELERFRQSAGALAVPGEGSNVSSSGSEVTFKTIRLCLEDIKETVIKNGASGVSDEMLEAVRGEFENVRTSISAGVVPAGGSNEEVLEAIRLGLDDLTSQIDKKLDRPDDASILSLQHGELLDVINEGLESLKADVLKALEKPVDMSVNYDILETLKDGLADLRTDLAKLKSGDGAVTTPKGGEVVLADETAIGEARDISGAAAVPVMAGTSATSHADIEKIEVLIAQLQIKIEALDATVKDLPAMDSSLSGNRLTKSDIVALETLLKDIHNNFPATGLRAEGFPGDGVAKKEDTDAIETLLRNTKAQLEDMADLEKGNAVRKEDLDTVEAVVRVTNDAIAGLSDRLENSTAAKADVAVVEILAQDVKTALEELKDRVPTREEEDAKPALMTKADLDVLGIMVTEIKTTVKDMVLPDPADIPSRSDFEQLQGLIADFRESHDKMRDSYETDIGVTAKAFDDRKQEFEDTVNEISQVKGTLGEVKDEILAKMTDGEATLDALHETLRSLDDRSEPIGRDVKALVEKVTKEFERAHGSIEAFKADHQLSSESSLEKQVENKEALVTELGEKIETYFDGLMTKYDDAQQAAEDKARKMEESASQQEELLVGMKTMADELRLSIDTLGATLTSFPDTMDKVTEESRIVFNKVDDTYNKLNEKQEGLKFEHSVTRDEVLKVLAAVGGLSNDLEEHNPRFMVTLKEVQAMIGQHYEHSQRASDAAAEHMQAVKELQEQIRGIGTQNEELKSNVSSLPALLPAPTAAFDGPTSRDKYDDTAIHEKLDRLVGQAAEGSNASTQLERLDQIHEKVMATAAEVSAFVTLQAKQITADQESHEKETEELALLLERRQVQKDEVEADITVLNEEKETLQMAVEALRAEKEALAAHKARLSAEVSSLETAMHIRREELHEMDAKAEAIERRMLEGVINQSRMLLLSKTSKPAPKKKPQGRDLRIPSNSSAASAQTVTSSLSPLKASHALAMRSRAGASRSPQLSNTAERRIMSLSQINHNVPTGSSAFCPAPSLTSNAAGQLMKRSHSVKTQPTRKPSWTAGSAKRKPSLLRSQFNDKENETLSDVSEDDFQRPDSRDTNEQDIAGSDDASSGRTYTDLGSARPSYDYSDLSYDGTGTTETGSYITGSELDRRTSLDSSSGVGVLGTHDEEESMEEEFHELDNDDDEPVAEAPEEGMLQLEPPPLSPWKKGKYEWAPPSDSGLGTDMPTAALSSVGSYFRG